jgi:uncharacterized membrane protein YoaK (UPF0700 family)
LKPQVLQWLAIGLSTLAGFVDAIGYLSLGSLFVSFMSGNSTVLGVSVVEELGARSWIAAGLVGCFVTGVMVGTWVGRPLGDRRAPVVLLLMATVLAVAAAVALTRFTTAACLLAALAMGCENTVFQRDAGPAIGLTYMTGTLVRLGQRLAEGFVGGAWSAAVPDFLLWLGMVAGACLGAATYRALHLDGLWIAVVVALAMAGLAWHAQRTISAAR